MCSDQITDVICLPIVEGGWIGRGMTPVLSCEDKTIKVSGNVLTTQLEIF
jgi:hypothetical protein